jgi:CRISPR-associated endonuclease Cas1
MGRPRCDPIDVNSVLLALAAGGTMLHLYRDYASTAARPYARASWEIAVRRAQRPGDNPCAMDQKYVAAYIVRRNTGPGYWEKRAPVKPARVLTLTAESPSLRVKGGALHVRDGGPLIVYEPRGVKPHAIVLTGWAGILSIQALRFCSDHNIAVVILDWSRQFMTAVMHNHKSLSMIRVQAIGDPIPIAKALIRAKVEAHLHMGAIYASTSSTAIVRLNQASSIEQILIAEAQAARHTWAQHRIIVQWREAGNIPASWKLPYSLRRRLTGKHAKGATDPINSLLNLILAVTVGRLTVAIAARGLSPAIGFLHKSPRWALSYDAIEPLRPHIETATFQWIAENVLAPSDFVIDTTGQVKVSRRLSRVVIDAVSFNQRTIDNCVDWLASLISGRATFGNCPSDLFSPSLNAVRKPIE